MCLQSVCEISIVSTGLNVFPDPILFIACVRGALLKGILISLSVIFRTIHPIKRLAMRRVVNSALSINQQSETQLRLMHYSNLSGPARRVHSQWAIAGRTKTLYPRVCLLEKLYAFAAVCLRRLRPCHTLGQRHPPLFTCLSAGE